MHVSDVSNSSARVLHVVDEMRWHLDWKLLDVDSISDREIGNALHELWVTVLAHVSLVDEVTERVEQLAEDDVGLAEALHPVLESLEQLRFSLEGLYRHRDVEPVYFAFTRFERSVERLIEAENEVIRTRGSVLFPAETS
jgi:hypothetical protein